MKRTKYNFRLDKYADKRRLTLEAKLVNDEFWKAMHPDARRRRANKLPTLAQIEMAKLLWPERKGILALQGRCHHLLEEKANHWTVKITRKLDRLIFPDLTQGRLETEQQRLAKLSPQELIAELNHRQQPSDPKRLGRLLAALKAACDMESDPERFRSSLFGIRLTKIIMDAVWKLDDRLLIEFGKAIRKESGTESKKARIYRFLRQNAEAVEQCHTIPEIRKLPGFPAYDLGSIYRLGKEIGLPVAK